MKLAFLLAFVWCCPGTGWCLPAGDHPGDETDTVPKIETTIVVTANRGETPLDMVGSTVYVLTRADLDQGHYRTVEEALATLPGIQVNRSGATGHVAGVMLRGAKSEHTLVLLDGMELNDPVSPGRSFDFGSLTLDQIERIEVILGPQSTLYGSDAVGGIIHIISRQGSGEPAVTGELEAGSYNSAGLRAGVSGEWKNLRFHLAAAHRRTGGFSSAAAEYGNSENDGWRQTSVFGRADTDFSPHWNGELVLHYFDDFSELDNWGGAFGDDPNYRQEGRRALARGQLRYRHPSGHWQQEFQLAYAGTSRRYENNEDAGHPGEWSRARYDGSNSRLAWQHLLLPAKGHTLSLGYEYEREGGKSYYHSGSLWGSYDSFFPRQYANTHSMFVQDRLEWREALFLTGGFRLDRHDRFGTNASFRLAPVALFKSTGTRLHASAGTGFKAPSLYQLYAPATAWGPTGNPGLQPEQSWNLDAGVSQFFAGRKVSAGTVYFYSQFSDLIDFVNGYQNVGKAISRGLESQLDWSPWPFLQAGLSYTYTNSWNVSSGEELLRRARHLGTFTVKFMPVRQVDVQVEVLHKGKRWDLDYTAYPAARVRLAPYTRLNLSASWRCREDLELYARMENLTNCRAEDIYGYGWAGPSARGGLRWNFK